MKKHLNKLGKIDAVLLSGIAVLTAAFYMGTPVVVDLAYNGYKMLFNA